MSRDLDYVKDILDAAKRILSYVNGISEQEFAQDEMRQDAVYRRFEVIGEATKRLSHDFRAKHAHMPWQLMAGMRDVLIHDYDKIVVNRIWNTTIHEIPALIQQLESLIASFPEPDEA